MKFFALLSLSLGAMALSLTEAEGGIFSRRQQVVVQNGGFCNNNQQVIVQQRRGFLGFGNRQQVIVNNRGFSNRGFNSFRSNRVLVVPQSFGFQRQNSVQFRFDFDD